MKTVLKTVLGQDINYEIDIATKNEIVTYVGKFDIDCDGSGNNPYGDKYFQPDTSLHFPAKPAYGHLPLWAELIPYSVVNPIIIQKTKKKVLGSLCQCTNLKNGKVWLAVVGDVGPHDKIGEGSPALARELGLDDDPNHGGTSEFIIEYKIFVGVPAIVKVRFDLQSGNA